MCWDRGRSGAWASRWPIACAGQSRALDRTHSKTDHFTAESPLRWRCPMARFLAGAAACFLLLTGAFLLWQSRAQGPHLPNAPAARSAVASLFGSAETLEA